jgi:glyoxylase-like metal-dependent hydrolase (beta-lactamase superfamily II)
VTLLKWTVGDVTITRIVELEVPVPYSEKRPYIRAARPAALAEMPWLYPSFVTPEGHVMTSVHALLVEAPGLRLIVDTCIGNDKPRRMTRGYPLSTPFLTTMAELGWSRDSVQAVICTHLHVDHVGWNTMLEGGKLVPTFPRARYLIGRVEHEHWRALEHRHPDVAAEQRAVFADSVQPLFDAGLVDLVETDHRLSEAIKLVPTPGHTPGHVSVAIESRGQRALITGDIMHHPCQIGRPAWVTEFDEDPAAATDMRHAMLAELADQPVLVIGTHFSAPTAGHIQREGESYRFAAWRQDGS